MVDRIRQLLQVRQLSPTQFADAIGVARPIVSHILGGRNKPSLEVVQKIIAAFPDIAMPWLLTGQGPMLAAEPETAPPKAADGPIQRPERSRTTPTQFRRAPRADQPRESVSTGQSGPVQLAEQPALPAAVEQPALIAPAATQMQAAAPGLDPLAAAIAMTATPSKVPKTIRRVLVFYSDGTFTDFSPSAEAL